jgi:hypothetical protein
MSIPPSIDRRQFLKATAALAASMALRAEAAPAPQKLIGIQAGAVSFVDEGVDQVLDVFQQAQVNAIFLATLTYGRGIAGRQVPGQRLPDHGKQEYDEKQFVGGNYATPHEQFYANTRLKIEHAPDHGDLDILETVIPKAKARGVKIYCWYEDNFDHDIPGAESVREVQLDGKRARTMCPLNPDYRNFLTGLTEDYCKSYDIDGVMWGSERGGPLDNIVTRPKDPQRVTCFCELHQQAAKLRGIDPDRAKEGFQKLADFIRAASAGERPIDGYFVTFWRILVEYPEIIAWEKLWTDSKHAIYGDIYKTAKSARSDIQVGFHIWHANSFSPFVRAEQDYAAFAKVADYLKIVVYNNCGGPRYARSTENFASTIFRDAPVDEVQAILNHMLNYGDEATHEKLSTAGLSADYVARETKRALDDVQSKCRIYPGIDIDIPTNEGEKKTAPDDVFASTTAALKAGADGVIFSRKYSEMRLENLAAGGRAAKAILK